MIYARYSTELQNPSSIDDQIRACRALIERRFGVSGDLAVVFSDAGMTGSRMARPGLKALLKAAASGTFDVLAAEGLDRISRNLKDLAAIHERLDYAGVEILTIHEGPVSKMHVGVKGVMNALFLDDLKARILRGQMARAAEGRAAGGLAYGYRAVRGVVDGRNRTVNGVREIDEERAGIVRRIFQEFADGKPVKVIARDLNNDGVPSPSGNIWKSPTLRGPPSSYSGILRLEIYRGVLIFNRRRKIINPETGRARRAINPESEWVRAEAPHLRIIEEPLWKRVQARLARDRALPPRGPRPKVRAALPDPAAAEPARTLRVQPFTGLVRCGACGGLANLADAQRYVCATARFTRKCRNYRAVRTPRLVEAVFPLLGDSLARSPDIRPHVAQALANDTERQRRLVAKHSRIHGRVGRLLTAVEEGVHHEQAIKRIRKLEDEAARIKRRMKLTPPPPPDEAAIRAGLSRALGRMEREFYDPAHARLLRRALGLLVARIVQTPIPDQARGSDVAVELTPAPWPGVWLLLADAWPETMGREG